ncbi:MAG: D-glycero-beta-D-manno-heptose 1-phosphate adenylyltransferase [Fimbriimonadia bacterium]
MPRALRSKIIPPEEVQSLADRLRREGKSIVFTNGCFDLLHTGHVCYLAEARLLGDCLIVGVNSDESVRAIKGPGRPFLPLEDRLTMLAALESVDAVTWFEESTPDLLIRAIRPTIHAKGGDYRVEDLGEADLVRELGGRVVVLSLVEGRSTSWLLDHIGRRLSGK